MREDCNPSQRAVFCLGTFLLTSANAHHTQQLWHVLIVGLTANFPHQRATDVWHLSIARWLKHCNFYRVFKVPFERSKQTECLEDLVSFIRFRHGLNLVWRFKSVCKTVHRNFAMNILFKLFFIGCIKLLFLDACSFKKKSMTMLIHSWVGSRDQRMNCYFSSVICP